MNPPVSLPALIFPSFEIKIDTSQEYTKIFDEVRKKYVKLTSEEWVRQHCIHWLVSKGYPVGRCSVERTLPSAELRYDVLWMDAYLNPFLLIECKSPSVTITHETLRQSAWYNLTLKAPYILLTNGLTAYCGRVPEQGTLTMLSDAPDYPHLTQE